MKTNEKVYVPSRNKQDMEGFRFGIYATVIAVHGNNILLQSSGTLFWEKADRIQAA